MSHEPTTEEVIRDLEYIASSPSREYGGFHPNAINVAKQAIAELRRLSIPEPAAPAPDVLLWAKEAADEMEEAIMVCDSLLPPAHLIYKGFNKEVAAAIIARHAP